MNHGYSCDQSGCWTDSHRVEFHRGNVSGLYVLPPGSEKAYLYCSGEPEKERLFPCSWNGNDREPSPWRGRRPQFHPLGCKREECWIDDLGIAYHPGLVEGVYLHQEGDFWVRLYLWNQKEKKLNPSWGISPVRLLEEVGETEEEEELHLTPKDHSSPKVFVRSRVGREWGWWRAPGEGITLDRSEAWAYSLEEVFPLNPENLLEMAEGAGVELRAEKFILWDSYEELWVLDKAMESFTQNRRKALVFSPEEAFRIVRPNSRFFLYPAPEPEGRAS